MLQPFVGRGWIPCRVIQYPKYSILNLAKCVFICGLCLLCPSVFVTDFIQRACARAYHFVLSVCLHTNLGLCSPTKFAVLSVRLLSPVLLSHERTFSRRFRCFLNGEHDVTSKSHTLNPKELKHVLLKDVGTINKDPLEDVHTLTCPKA